MTHAAHPDLTFVPIEAYEPVNGFIGLDEESAKAKASALIDLLFTTQARGEKVVRSVDVARRTALGPAALAVMGRVAQERGCVLEVGVEPSPKAMNAYLSFRREGDQERA